MGLYVLLAGVAAASILLARELGRLLVPWWRGRRAVRAAHQREQMAKLEPGGASDRPIAVESASVVEARARSMTCARCDSAMRLDEHAAELHGAETLRIARLRCPRCEGRRAVYFRIVET